MRIALDCRSVFAGMGGIGRYTWCLLRELAAIDTMNEYVCIFTHLSPPEPIALPSRFALRIFEAGMIDERFDQFLLPSLLEEEGVDLYHNPTFAIPAVGGRTGTVATVHDVIFRRYPELVEPKLREYLDAATRRACRRADRIIAVSEHSKAELTRLYDVDGSHVRVIHNGVKVPLAGGEIPLPLRLGEMGLTPEKYALYAGSIEPKKNIGLLLTAFRNVRERRPEWDFRLVLAGSVVSSPEPRIRELGLAGRVHVLGHVPEDVLEALYAHAFAFVYPSLYEGFGLPPLEAMARGVPTIVSNASSLPEVVGEAAILVDPEDPEPLTRALIALADQPLLRRDFAEKGRRRAALFPWRRSAEQHLEIYEEARRSHENLASCV